MKYIVIKPSEAIRRSYLENSTRRIFLLSISPRKHFTAIFLHLITSIPHQQSRIQSAPFPTTNNLLNQLISLQQPNQSHRPRHSTHSPRTHAHPTRSITAITPSIPIVPCPTARRSRFRNNPTLRRRNTAKITLVLSWQASEPGGRGSGGGNAGEVVGWVGGRVGDFGGRDGGGENGDSRGVGGVGH